MEIWVYFPDDKPKSQSPGAATPAPERYSLPNLFHPQPKHTVGSMQGIQLDYTSYLHRALVPILNASCARAAPGTAGLCGRLAGWDGDTSLGSEVAVLFEKWWVEVARGGGRETGTCSARGGGAAMAGTDLGSLSVAAALPAVRRTRKVLPFGRTPSS